MLYVNQSSSGTGSDQINEEHKRRIRYASLKITCLLPAKALTGAVICSILLKGSDDYRKKVQTMKLMIRDLQRVASLIQCKQDTFYQVTIPLGSSLDQGSIAFTCITGGVVSLTLDTDISLSSKMCGGVLDKDGGEWEAES